MFLVLYDDCKGASKITGQTGGSRPARRLTFFSPPSPGLAALTRASLSGAASRRNACHGNNRCHWPFPSGLRRCGLAQRTACRSLGCFSCWPGALSLFGETNGTSTHRTLATAMPAAGDALSAYSLERQRVRRRPGAQPRIQLIRPQGRKQNQKQNRRVASRQTPYFFQREKSKQKRFLYYCCTGSSPLLPGQSNEKVRSPWRQEKRRSRAR